MSGGARLNRIYVRQEDIASSLYKRRKERSFTTEDVMRLHWDRQGAKAIAWAREIIKRMLKAGVIESFKPDDKMHAVEGDNRRVLYRFTEERLKELGLDQ